MFDQCSGEAKRDIKNAEGARGAVETIGGRRARTGSEEERPMRRPVRAVQRRLGWQDVGRQLRRGERGRREGSDAGGAPDCAHANPSPRSIRARRSSAGVSPSRRSTCTPSRRPATYWTRAGNRARPRARLQRRRRGASADPRRPRPSIRRIGSEDIANRHPGAPQAALWRGGVSRPPAG